MARPPAEAGAWTFVGYSAAVAILTPATRLVADAQGFVTARLPLADFIIVGYAVLAGGFVFSRIRHGKAGRWLAVLTIPPFLFEAAGPGGLVGSFTLDLSGYPVILVILLWLGNLAILALVASLVLLLLAAPSKAIVRPAV